MKWYKAHVNLKGHPKRYRFEEALGTEHGLHYIHLWFCYVAEYAPTGDVTHFSRKEIAKACEWTGEADRFFDALSVSGFIEKVKGGIDGFRLIAHDWFNENERYIKENERRKPTGNPRVTRVKPTLEVREEKRIEEKKEKKPKPLSPDGDESFMAFYSAYPRKDARADAWKAWKQKRPDLLAVLKALAWQRKQDSWLERENGKLKFVPMPASYLRGERWLDEPPYQARPVERIIPKTMGEHFKVGF